MPGTHEPGGHSAHPWGVPSLVAPRTTLLTEGVHSPRAQDHMPVMTGAAQHKASFRGITLS